MAVKKTPIAKPEVTAKKPMKIGAATTWLFDQAPKRAADPLKLPDYPKGVYPAGHSAKMAYDSSGFGWSSGIDSYHGLFQEGIGFQGYPYYAQLSQRVEYRMPCQVIAEEATRKWITIKGQGDKDLTKKVNELTDAMEHYKLRDVFRDALEKEETFGLSFIYPDLMLSENVAVSEDYGELETRLVIDKTKIPAKSLRGFLALEPTWMAPTSYNANNQLDPTFFKPQYWFSMGKRVHSSRLLQLVARPVSDILKPSYNFGGTSLVQEMEPYVSNWLRARQSVSDIMSSFTVWNLQTDMQSILMGGGPDAVMNRGALFAWLKSNYGLFMTDKSDEDLKNIAVSLANLDKLQAQAQEHLSGPARIPQVKLLGITPSGLNTSTDDEIRTFYDTIHGLQQKVFQNNLKTCLDILQLNEYGEIDENIVFDWNPLWELDSTGEAAVIKNRAEVDAVYLDHGVLSPDEVRTRLANDPDSEYAGLEGSAPEAPDLDMDGSEGPSKADDPEGVENASEKDSNAGPDSDPDDA